MKGFKLFISWVLTLLFISGMLQASTDFSTGVAVNSRSGDQKDPALTIDSNGTLYAVWVDYNTTTNLGDIYFSKSVDGGSTWSTEVQVDGGTTTRAEQPALAVDTSGIINFVWLDFRAATTAGDIYSSRSIDGGLNFSTGIIIDGSGSTVETPSIVAGAGGNVYVTWRDMRAGGTNGDIYFDKSTDYGATFGTDVLVDNSGGKVEKPSISVDSGGRLYIAWRDFRTDTTGGDIYISTSTDAGATWSAAIRVDDGTGSASAAEPSIFCSPVNTTDVYAVWTDSRTSGNNGDIYFAVSTNNGTSFGASKQIDNGGTSAADEPTIVLDSSGRISVGWRDFRNGDPDIFFARSTDGGTTFSHGIRVNRDTQGTGIVQLFPSLAVDSVGRSYAVWQDGRDGNFSIYSAKSPKLVTPLAPTGLTATAGDNQVTLDWSNNTESDLSGYNVYRATTAGGTYTKLNLSLLTSSDYVSTGLTNGTKYYFVVTAVDTAANESGNSDEVNATPGNPSAPASPTGLTATAGATTVDLSWTAPTTNSDGTALTDLSGYNVYRSISSGGAFTKINSSTITVTTYQDTGRTSGTTYYYKVSALDDDSNESVLTSAVSATPQTRGSTLAPSAPTGLSAKTGSTIVDLTWTANTETDLSGYNVYRSIASGGSYTKINSSTVTVASYQDTGRTNDTTYYYVITAVDDDTNESNYSSETSAIPKSRGGTNAPNAPTGLTATAGNTTVDFSWTAPTTNVDTTALTDLSGYNIYRSISSGGGYTKINSATLTAATFQDTGRTNGVTYYYVVTALDSGSNESSFSTEANATPQVRGNSNAPSKPTSPTATAGNTEVTLTWVAPTTNQNGTTLTDLSGYNIYRSINSGGGYTKINTATVTALTYEDTGLTNGVRYYYVVTAIDADSNESNFSTEVNAVPQVRGSTNAPSAPTGLSAVPGNTIVDLTWSAPTTNGDGSALTDLAGYNVYRSIISGGGYTKVNSSTLTAASFQDTGLTNDVRYYYVVTAVDTSDNESNFSSETNATPQERGTSGAPSSPASLTATAGNTLVDLGWTAPTTNQNGSVLVDLAGYNVYRSISSGGGYTKINTSTVTALTFQDTGLTNGVRYYYVVTAIDIDDNESSYSTEANATPQERGSSTAPSAPTGLTATGGSTVVDLSWTAPTTNQDGTTLTDLSGYNIYRRTGASGVFAKINSSLTTIATFQDTGLTNGTTYYYKVTAVDTDNNESNFSTDANATPQERGSSAAPSAPTALTATGGAATVDLSWTAPTTNQDGTTLTDLAGYNVYRRTGTSGIFGKVNSSLLTDAEFEDTDLTNGTTYYYKVTAVDESDNESNFSDLASATPSDSAPAAPVNLIATGADDKVTLTWDANTETDLAGYNVYRSTTSGSGYTKLNSSVVTTNTYEDTGLTPLVHYFYVVTAVDNGDNESGNSNEVDVRGTSEGGGTEGGGGAGCFIATAAYGSRLAPEVQTLCEFRDSRLMGNTAGERAVSIYYRYGPYLARFVERHPSMKSIIRGAINPLLWGVKRSVKK